MFCIVSLVYHIFDFAWLLTCKIFRKGDTLESQSEISLDLFVFNHKST